MQTLLLSLTFRKQGKVAGSTLWLGNKWANATFELPFLLNAEENKNGNEATCLVIG